MASPFPGMDPYLEGDLWTTFHSQIAVEIARQLAPKIAPRYVALTEKSYVLDSPEELEITIEGRYADVGIVEARSKNAASPGTAVLEAPVEVATVMAERVPHFWVEIRDRKKRKLVTAIEILSPANKRGQGRRDYLEKREKLLHSSAHLLEIDLVRQGKTMPMLKRLPKAAYYAFLCRAGRRPIAEVWPILLDKPLPPLPVPLLKGDPDAPLNLQEAFTKVYDGCRYDLILDYSHPPDVPLPPSATGWLKKTLKAAGIR